ncbi:hypothetical protein KP509_1Z302900 [Ceratopteris richardii]|nr:hypothetical protein KP509_1Z302900 [Ceratopteris richardii]
MPSLGWRWLLGLSSVPLLVLLIFYPFVPESPRYLMAKGRADEALEVLRWISRVNKRPLPAGQIHQENWIPVNSGGRPEFLNEAVRLIKTLFSSSMIQSTLLLWIVFFANAFTYYGLVLLTTQLSGQTTACGSTVNASQTIGESIDVYKSALVTSFAGKFTILILIVVLLAPCKCQHCNSIK